MDIVHYTTKFESSNYSAIVEKFGHEQIFNIRMFKGETSHIDYNKLINYYVWWPRIKMAMKELVLS